MSRIDDPENTGEKRKPVPPVEHQFKPGNSGRPKGSRNKLGEAFVAALHDDFTKHGVKAIETVRAERPHEYLKVVASLLPKQVEIKEDAFGDLTDEQLAAVLASVTAALGIEGQTGAGGAEAGEPEPPGRVPAVH